MKTIKPVAVLDYYDGIQLFEGRDAIGGHYIAVLLGSVDKAERFLVTGAAPDRLRQFRVGDLDLRTLLLEAPGGEWFFIYADVPYGDPLTLIPQEGPLSEREDLLPDEGYTMDDAPIDDLARKRALESNNTVFEFSVEPPEAAHEHRVRADALGEILTQTQIVMKHAYRNALRELPKSKLPDIDSADGYLMDVVVPAAPGSFRVVLEMATSHDGYAPSEKPKPGELVRALELVDEVFQSAEYPEAAQEILLKHKGHLAKAYLKLLGILAERNTSFNYSWADPQIRESQYGGVSAPVAQKLYETLSKRFGVYVGRRVKRVIEGDFVRMNMESDSWGLRSRRGVRQGKIRDDGPSLQGLIAGKRYRFHCVDEIEIDAMGREKSTLYLERIERLNTGQSSQMTVF